LPITSANYKIAVELLKKRFARPAVIKHAYINQLIGLSTVFNEDNFSRLHNSHDYVEAHIRGLKSVSVDKISYSAIMEKVPKQVQLIMVRDVGKTMLGWTLDEFIKASIMKLAISSNSQRLRL